MKKRALVTGGAGFIGSNLVDFLIRKNWEVVVLDDLSTGKLSNVNKKALFFPKDISGSVSGLIPFFADIDVVFHLAAWARVPRSVADPIGTNRVNVGGTLNVLQVSRMLNIKRVVLSSSSSVYGDQDTYLMNEKMKELKPKSPYGLQKLIGEKYASLFSHLFKMQIVSLRYFNVYGYRQVTEGAYSLVIGKFMKQKADGLPMTIYGDGKQTRAYCWVGDVVKANWLAANSKINSRPYWHEIFNIGTNQETSVNKVAKLIGGDIKHIIPNPRGDFEEKRKAADFSKAKKLLKWSPTVNIKEGIRILKNER